MTTTGGDQTTGACYAVHSRRALLRWFVHPQSRRSICVDQWETVGPERGIFQERFGGFVDPSCLMLNKVTGDRYYPL